MERLNDWEDIRRYRDEHCPKCTHSLPGRDHKHIGYGRCDVEGGTSSAFVIELGKCRFEEVGQ